MQQDFHGSEKKDRGCTSTNFHLSPTWTTVKVSRSFLRAGAPPLLGAASISASTARFALSPSSDVSIKLRWTRMESVWPKKELICCLNNGPSFILSRSKSPRNCFWLWPCSASLSCRSKREAVCASNAFGLGCCCGRTLRLHNPTEKQRNENGRRAATHVHRLLGRRRPPMSAGLP